MSSIAFEHLFSPQEVARIVAKGVALPGGTVDCSHADFVRDVRKAISLLCSNEAQLNQQSILLFSKSTYQFLVLFCAAVCLRKNIVLPQNGSVGAIADLVAEVDAMYLDDELANELSARDASVPVYAIESVWLNDIPLANIQSFDQVETAVSVVIFTSGSSGEPKAIHKKLSCFMDELRGLDSLWSDYLSNSEVVATVSHQHVYGLLFRALWPLFAGGVFWDRQVQYPEELVAIGRAAKKIFLISSPAFLSRLPAHSDLQFKGDVAAIISSGGPLAVSDNFRAQQALSALVIEVFGSSETGGVAYRSRTPQDDALVWQLLPGVSYRASENGLLLVSSPYVYTNEPFEMGDKVTVLDDHRFEVCGRADRIAKIEEKRVSLDEVEQRILDTKLVAINRVLILPGKRTVLAAVVVLTEKGQAILGKDGKLALTRAIKAGLLPFLEPIVVPKKWRVVDSLPMNAQGKVTQQALQQLFE